MVTLTPQAYRDRVRGSWLGKLIGRAAGAPEDGYKRPLEIADAAALLAQAQAGTTAEMVFSRAWLEALLTHGAAITSDHLVRAWLDRVPAVEWEYGYARANFLREVRPPVSGVHDNPFRESLGAVARAEVWGLLAPGDPVTAARYAWQDAILDHAGSGVSAAVALAGAVSTAFAESSPERLVETALRVVARDSRVAQVMRDVARWHGELTNWRRTREMLLRSYATEEVRDGAIALGFVTLALLDGEGDFVHSLLTAARCGWSTFCVCGAVGAVLGAMHGAAHLPEAWTRLFPAAADLEWLIDTTEAVGQVMVTTQSEGRSEITETPAEDESRLVLPEAGRFLQRMAMGPYVISFPRGSLEVFVDYELVPTIGYDQPRRVGIGLVNQTDRSIELQARFAAPEGFVAIANDQPVTLPEGGMVSFFVSLTAPTGHCTIETVNQCLLLLSVEDEAEVVVPVTLLGESLWYAAGPFPEFEQAYAPESAVFLIGQEALGGEGWRRLSVTEPAVNIVAGMEGEQGVYYLATDVFSSEARPVLLRVGGNDGLRVWLNGDVLLSHHEHRPVDARVSADECEGRLVEGWNRLVMKMAQCSSRRFLSVTWRTPQLSIVTDLSNTSPRA